jgi:hypothetical protein
MYKLIVALVAGIGLTAVPLLAFAHFGTFHNKISQFAFPSL